MSPSGIKNHSPSGEGKCYLYAFNKHVRSQTFLQWIVEKPWCFMIYSPLLTKILNNIFGSKDLRDLAIYSEKSSSLLTKTCLPAIYFADDLKQVTGVAYPRKIEWELGRIQRKQRTYNSLQTHTIENVILLDGNLYKGTAKRRIKGQTAKFFAKVPSQIQEGGILVNTEIGARYFGDWLLLDLPLLRLAIQFGHTISIDSGKPLTQHQFAYKEMFSAKETRALTGPCIIDKITIFESSWSTIEHVAEAQKMRRLLQKRLGSELHPGVYFCRGDSGASRVLVNEKEVIAFMRNLGLLIINPEELNADEITRLTFNAKLVVGVEGSQLAHGIFCLADRGCMLVLQPPYRFNNPYKDQCDALGFRYAFTIGEACEGGFRINLSRVEKLLKTIGF